MAYNGLLNETLTLQATPSTIVDWSGGEGLYIGDGTWNGATLTLQVRSNVNGNWISMGSAAELTADGAIAFVAPSGCQLRIEASVADPTGVAVSILKMGRQ